MARIICEKLIEIAHSHYSDNTRLSRFLGCTQRAHVTLADGRTGTAIGRTNWEALAQAVADAQTPPPGLEPAHTPFQSLSCLGM